MSVQRCFLLLEVVIGLALLAAIGVWLLRVQSAALRQYRAAEQRTEVSQAIETLLWSWREAGVAVTLPASGRFDGEMRWRRTSQPVRIASGLLATEVTLVVERQMESERPSEVYRVSWLVPEPPSKRERR